MSPRPTAPLIERNVLAHFPDARRNGAGWSAKCPAHDDRKASLSLGRGDDGRTLLHCHAGCTLDAILAAAHLELAQLFPETTHTEKTISAIYKYHDEHGGHLFDVVRYHPKAFLQRRADGEWTMKGVRRVLYHLPDLQGKPFACVVEGEKDADRLRAIGVTATTNPMGADKWDDAYAQQLTAAGVKHVTIIPDNDDPGRTHAESVARSCHAAGLQVKVVTLPDLPVKGDVFDWITAGHTKAELLALAKTTAVYVPAPMAAPTAPMPSGRIVKLTAASLVTPRPVRWLWEGRVALGTFALLGGREGIGKSIVECTLTADITRGRLPGVYFGTPRAVMIAATEDSWEYSIVPRLMAADADLDRVFRVDVETTGGIDTPLSLPRDLPAVERLILEHQVAILMLDPVLSRLEAELDSHKDAEVRQALEPLVAVLERTSCSALGLIHVNKSTSNDPLTTLMASRAFAAVARAVLFLLVDPDDDTTRLLGQPKNNLGRGDLPTLAFQIAGAKVAETDEGPVWTGKLQWTGVSDRLIRDALQQTAETTGCNRTAVTEAAEWLEDYLTSQDGSADSADVKRRGAKAGHALATLQRARTKLKIVSIPVGFPRQTHWKLHPPQSSHPVVSTPGENDTTDTTETTAANRCFLEKTIPHQLSQSSQSSQSFHTPREGDTTEATTTTDSDEGEVNGERF